MIHLIDTNGILQTHNVSCVAQKVTGLQQYDNNMAHNGMIF